MSKKLKLGKGILSHKPELCNYNTPLSEEELKKIIRDLYEKQVNSYKGREFVIYPPLKN